MRSAAPSRATSSRADPTAVSSSNDIAERRSPAVRAQVERQQAAEQHKDSSSESRRRRGRGSLSASLLVHRPSSLPSYTALVAVRPQRMLRQVSRIARLSSARGYASTRPAFGGVVTQVIGAVVDVKVGSTHASLSMKDAPNAAIHPAPSNSLLKINCYDSLMDLFLPSSMPLRSQCLPALHV